MRHRGGRGASTTAAVADGWHEDESRLTGGAHDSSSSSSSLAAVAATAAAAAAAPSPPTAMSLQPSGDAAAPKAATTTPDLALLLTQLDGSQPVVFRVGALGDAYWSWVHQAQPGQPRFFRSSLLEAVSKTPWWVVPALWLPVFSACLAHAHARLAVPAPCLLAYMLCGVVAWQLLEYLIHRFVFHAHLTSYWGITFHFLFHGNHHKWPMDHLRLVFPPVPAAAVIAAVYWALHATLPPPVALSVFGGMGYGYVAYDCLHYAIHHAGGAIGRAARDAATGPAASGTRDARTARGSSSTGSAGSGASASSLRWAWRWAAGRVPGAGLVLGVLGDLQGRHFDHHYRDHQHGYGISSTLFDVLLSTSSGTRT